MESIECKKLICKQLNPNIIQTNEPGNTEPSGIKLSEVAKILNSRVICGGEKLDKVIGYAFASDLMSDVLTLDTGNLMLLTGLANLQAIRTAEMSDISTIVFVRCKKVSEEMITLAKENGMVLMEANITMFHASGLLYKAGIKPVF